MVVAPFRILALISIFGSYIRTEPTSSSVCKCSHISYGADEMSGELKSPGYPERYCDNLNCTYEIEPNPNFLLRLSVESVDMEREYDFLHLYQYVVINSSRQLIFQKDLNSFSKDSNVAGQDVGFYIVMESDHTSGGTFRLSFDRVVPNTQSFFCPFPFFYADGVQKNITAVSWPPSGCSFRLFSTHNIHVKSVCSDYSHGWRLEGRRPGETEILFEHNVYTQRFEDTLDSMDIRIYSDESFYRRRSMESCVLNYFSVDFDPCECPPNLDLKAGEIANFSSPGYPNLLCKGISCSTTIKTAASDSKRAKNGFRVMAIHAPHSFYDTLNFEVDSLTVFSLRKGEHIMEGPLTWVGNELLVRYYSAAASFGGHHGFFATVEVVRIPVDCLCPSNMPKDMEWEGRYMMHVPRHCEQMTCRFVIPRESTDKRIFRLTTKFHFPNEEEDLIVKASQETIKYQGQGSVTVKRRLNVISDTPIQLQYRRSLGEFNDSSVVASEDSFFEIHWLWMGSNDCSCHDGLIVAHNEWEELYSPRYPGDYCLNHRCTYILEAPFNHHLVINTTYFDTEPHADFLTFFDGNETTNNRLLQLHGHVHQAPILISSGRNVTIIFTSDNSITKSGFIVTYRAVEDPDLSDLEHEHLPYLRLFGLVLLLIAICSVVGVTLFKRKHQSFRNPAYVPSVRYSIDESA